MPHKGWFYKVEGLTEDMKKWNNWYGKLDEVRGGTIVKCLEIEEITYNVIGEVVNGSGD